MKEKEAKDAKKEVDEARTKWCQQFPHRTRESLIKHGQDILKPVAEYYEKLFKDEDGDCYEIRKCAEAAEIFDPRFLATIENDTDIVLELHTRADKLIHFGYHRQFNAKFFSGLKREMRKLVKEAQCDHSASGRRRPKRKHSTGRTMQVNMLSEFGLGGSLEGRTFLSLPWH